MTRDAFADQLLDLVYGELSSRDARKVEAHAASCEACRAELARIRETRGLMARLPEEPAPEKGERVLLAAAREAAERRAAPRRIPPRWAWGASVAAASLLAVAAVSYRILALRPGPLSSRPDREALLGDSYATPPAPAPAPAAEAARAAPAEQQERSEEPPGARSAAAPSAPARKSAPVERPPRAFAEPPPPAADQASPAERKLHAPGAAAARPAAPGAEAGAAASPEAPFGARPAAPPPPAAAAPITQGVAPPAPAAAADAAPRARRVEQEAAGVRREATPAAKASAAPRGVASGTAGAPAGGPRSTTRSFPGCEGELARTVVTDEQGRVVRSVREGRFDGRRLRIVQTFGPDGAPASATAQDLDAGGAPVDPRALGIALADRAEDANLDAPPRCGR